MRALIQHPAGPGGGEGAVVEQLFRHSAGRIVATLARVLGPARLDEERGDAFGRGATCWGVRMLVELVTRLAGG